MKLRTSVVIAVAMLTSTSAIVFAEPLRGPIVKVLVGKPNATMPARVKPVAPAGTAPAPLTPAERTAALASVAAAKLAPVPGRQSFDIDPTHVVGPKGEGLFVEWCEYGTASVYCFEANLGVGVANMGKGGWLVDCSFYGNPADDAYPFDVAIHSASGTALDTIVPHKGHIVFAAVFDQTHANSISFSRPRSWSWTGCKIDPI